MTKQVWPWHPLRPLLVTVVLLITAEALAAERLQVFAGIPPAAFLVQRVGAQRVQVETLIHAGQDPHTFEPSPKQIESLSKARLFFKAGMPFENQLLEKIREARPDLIVVDITTGIEKRRLSSTGSTDEADQAAGQLHGDSPPDLDPHVWLSPPLLKIEAANVAAALEKLEPAQAENFQANLARLQQELDALDAKIRTALKPYEGRAFYVYHPAFGYFGDCYHLRQEAVEAEGKQPSPSQLRRLIQRARADGTKVIFVQPQFDQHSAQTVAQAIGGRIVPLNDIDEDVIANLQDIANKIERALSETSREQ